VDVNSCPVTLTVISVKAVSSPIDEVKVCPVKATE